ncbi:MAG TPA: phasin family protein [Chloroflexota bacterium]|nr:phasin family protein [Chloroflexota bacterium]
MNEETVSDPTDTVHVEVDVDATAAGRSQRPLRRAFLAGIGAMATACDRADQTFDEFVTRGERVRDEWTERADELRRENRGARGRMGEYFRGAMDAFLDTLNVPNKTDVDTINVKLNILTRKIDDLQMDALERATPSRTAGGPAAPESPPS